MKTAIIIETACIGCACCRYACPVDAIIGTRKFLHTILFDECIGCKLCINLCPVDCIQIVPLTVQLLNKPIPDKYSRAFKAKRRYCARKNQIEKLVQPTLPQYTSKAERTQIIVNNIRAALDRVKARRKSK